MVEEEVAGERKKRKKKKIRRGLGGGRLFVREKKVGWPDLWGWRGYRRWVRGRLCLAPGEGEEKIKTKGLAAAAFFRERKIRLLEFLFCVPSLQNYQITPPPSVLRRPLFIGKCC